MRHLTKRRLRKRKSIKKRSFNRKRKNQTRSRRTRTRPRTKSGGEPRISDLNLELEEIKYCGYVHKKSTTGWCVGERCEKLRWLVLTTPKSPKNQDFKFRLRWYMIGEDDKNNWMSKGDESADDSLKMQKTCKDLYENGNFKNGMEFLENHSEKVKAMLEEKQEDRKFIKRLRDNDTITWAEQKALQPHRNRALNPPPHGVAVSADDEGEHNAAFGFPAPPSFPRVMGGLPDIFSPKFGANVDAKVAAARDNLEEKLKDHLKESDDWIKLEGGEKKKGSITGLGVFEFKPAAPADLNIEDKMFARGDKRREAYDNWINSLNEIFDIN